MKRLFAFCFLLSACCFGQAADRLSFTNHAPQVLPEVWKRMTNSGAIYYSTARTPAHSNNVIPVATCTNLPLGALCRRVWARVLYPNVSGELGLNQLAFANGAVRFYRGGVLVGSLPYRSGAMRATTTNDPAIAICRGMLFGEVGDKSLASKSPIPGANLANQLPDKPLLIEIDNYEDAFANAFARLGRHH